MSLRASTVPPVACSGDMYAGVPATAPGRLSRARGVSVVASSPSSRSACVSFARPKSSTLTTPSGVTMTFAGFRSRWTMPGGVGRGERVGDRDRDAQRLAEAHPAARDERVERLAGHQLHHDEVDPVARTRSRGS